MIHSMNVWRQWTGNHCGRTPSCPPQGRDAETNFPHEHYSERWAELTGGITLAALAVELRAERRARQAADSCPRADSKHGQSKYKCVSGSQNVCVHGWSLTSIQSW